MLLCAGLELQAEQPLMICSPDALCPPVPVDPFDSAHDRLQIQDLDSNDPDALLELYERVAAEGFADQHPPEPSELSRRRLREELRAGVRRAAIGWIGDAPAGVAAISPMGATGELVGVTTLERFRRRKIASTLSAHLVADHFARGGEVAWLSAGDSVAQATYRSIGFTDAGIYGNYISPE